MKRLLVLMLVLAIGMFMLPAKDANAITGAYTGATKATAGAGINGTVHDLRRANTLLGYKASPDDYLDRICIFCHAPHHAYRLPGTVLGTGPVVTDSRYNYLPLWNHPVTTQSFTGYYPGPGMPDPGTSMKGPQSYAEPIVIGEASLLCLSCHDGTVAVNTYGNAPQDSRSISTGTTTMTAQYRIGGDGYLANHHPIGFTYDNVAAVDLEIFDSATAVFDHTIDASIPPLPTLPQINVAGVTPVANVLWNGKMECSTCHAVHNTGNTGEKLLYVSDSNSNLCLSCHNKGVKTSTLAVPTPKERK